MDTGKLRFCKFQHVQVSVELKADGVAILSDGNRYAFDRSYIVQSCSSRTRDRVVTLDSIASLDQPSAFAIDETSSSSS